jgi:CBS domain containing-hemolysin-like protein
LEDGISILLNILLVLFLVLLNAFFVASEFALVRVRGTRLAELASSGNKRAKIAQHVTSRLDAYLSACQLGITLASLGLGWVGEPAVAHLIVEPLMEYFGAPEYMIAPVSFGIAFAIITFLHIVLGELAPKSIAIFKSEGTSLWLSGPLMLFYKMAYPAIWLLNGTANTLLRWIGIQPASEHESGHTEEEIRILMKESQKSGHIDENELELVENIFDFSERVAREIMIPRTMLICLYADAPFEENLRIVQQERHTRYPVVEHDKDHIMGWVHASDVYNAALSSGPHAKRDIREFIRPMKVVPESMEISQVLKTMQKDRTHMVTVVDEFGGTAGLITLEDIIEEIVGDIQDEIREERAQVEVLQDRTSLDARMLIEEVNELFHIDIVDGDVDTIGGWMYSHLDEAPKVGDTLTYGHLVFKITEVEHLRIQRIEVNALPWTGEEESGDEEDIEPKGEQIVS